ncbi:hypothetical protein NUSPORA_01326 [Nucleospora cyclopteri]
MGKTQTKDANKKPKSLKDQIKELKSRLFGEKDNKKKKEIQNMIKKMELEVEKENKARQERDQAKKTVVRQLIPVGVDPKTIMCLNFKNKNCSLGEKCQFSHEIIIKEKTGQEEEKDEKKPKLVCKFLIDALNNNEYSSKWNCPNPKCKDIHKLIELSENKEAEVSLEEYLELQRQTLEDEKLTPVTEITFREWKEKKLKEEELHAKRVAALSISPKGVDLFKIQPEIFDDDEEEGEEIDYHAREEVSQEEEEE